MGLRIKAYESVELVAAISLPEWNRRNRDPQRGHIYLCQAQGFVDRHSYRNGMADGLYCVSGRQLEFSVAYDNYENWLSQLALMFGSTVADIKADPDPRVPFIELIDFTDSLGFISAKTSAELVQDFVMWRTSAARQAAWFGDLYKNFAQAFALAAYRGGVVDFG